MRVQDLVPEIYYKESRDFSYIGRVFEILFNFLKTNVDLVGETFINNEINASIVELASLTLGFESKHQYQTKDLSALCSVFSSLLRNKGSKRAIDDAISLLLHTQNIDEESDVDIDSDDKYKYIIYVPEILSDIILLEDIFEYILPVGTLYSFRRSSSGSGKFGDTPYVINMEPHIATMQSYQLGQVSGSGNVDELAIGNDANRSMTYTSTVVGASKQDTDNNN